MINASPWVSDVEKSEATCRCKRGRRRAGGKKINIRNENVSLRVSIFAFLSFLTNFSSDLSVHTQNTTGTLLSFVLGTASPGPRSSLPARGEVSCATDFTQFPGDQGDLGISTHPTAVLSTAQPALPNYVLSSIEPSPAWNCR